MRVAQHGRPLAFLLTCTTMNGGKTVKTLRLFLLLQVGCRLRLSILPAEKKCVRKAVVGHAGFLDEHFTWNTSHLSMEKLSAENRSWPCWRLASDYERRSKCFTGTTKLQIWCIVVRRANQHASSMIVSETSAGNSSGSSPMEISAARKRIRSKRSRANARLYESSDANKRACASACS